MSQTKCVRVKFLPLAAASAFSISIILPYVVAVVKEKVISFLPYISHAAGFPPQSAILSIFMTLGAFFGVFTFILRYVTVDHRRHQLEPKKIKIFNKVAVGVGIVAVVSVIFASHFPVAFVTHEKYDWIFFVILPHLFGSACAVAAFTIYILIQSYLTYTQRKKSAINVSVHATLAMCIVVLNWTSGLPFFGAMRELFSRTVDEETGEINLQAYEYSFYYIISSLSGWLLFLLVFLFIGTFFADMKTMKVTMTVRRRRVKADTEETAVTVTTNGHEQMTKM